MFKITVGDWGRELDIQLQISKKKKDALVSARGKLVDAENLVITKKHILEVAEMEVEECDLRVLRLQKLKENQKLNQRIRIGRTQPGDGDNPHAKSFRTQDEIEDIVESVKAVKQRVREARKAAKPRQPPINYLVWSDNSSLVSGSDDCSSVFTVNGSDTGMSIVSLDECSVNLGKRVNTADPRPSTSGRAKRVRTGKIY